MSANARIESLSLKRAAYAAAALIALGALGSGRAALASHRVHDNPSPPGIVVAHPGTPDSDDDRGGGGQPDPLTIFNQHVELADGELYLLKGEILMAPGLLGESRKLQPYFSVDLDAHPWLAGKERKQSPLYMIEGPLSSWRPYNGSYGELAAEAHVQLFINSAGAAVQLISLKPIPELCSLPRPNN